jgi:predicted Kef-type K+ transport protein
MIPRFSASLRSMGSRVLFFLAFLRFTLGAAFSLLVLLFALFCIGSFSRRYPRPADHVVQQLRATSFF